MNVTPSPSGITSAAQPGGKSGDQPASSSSSTAQSAGGAHNKIDAAKVTEILNETNKMLKSLTSPQAAPVAPSSGPIDPLESIQKQLDEVRRLKVMVVKQPCEATSSFASALAWYETRLSSSALARTESAEGG